MHNPKRLKRARQLALAFSTESNDQSGHLKSRRPDPHDDRAIFAFTPPSVAEFEAMHPTRAADEAAVHSELMVERAFLEAGHDTPYADEVGL